MAPEVPAALLTDIKDYLDITWADASTDRKTLGYIRSGMAYLNDKLGESADYEADGEPRTLLFDYCRYARDSALDVFEANYLSRILAMQHRRQVRAFAQKNL